MKKFILICFGVFVLVAIGGGAGAWVALRNQPDAEGREPRAELDARTARDEKAESPAASDKNSLYATMLGLSSSMGFRGDKSMEELATESWMTLAGSASYKKFLSNFDQALDENVPLVEETRFASNRDVIGPFVWNVVQPTRGAEYDWTLADKTMAAAGDAGITVSAVVYPFASWDATERIDPKNCAGIDFVYYDYTAGVPADWDAYEAFLTAMVERYDGDGTDDMPGLATRVESWEIGNEVEGSCATSLGEAANYVKLLKASYATIHAADPDAIVSNGGALEIVGVNGSEIPKTVQFWEEFFAQGGGDYLDVFNFHYNRERYRADKTSDVWQKHLDFYAGLLAKYELDKPMWVGEFGTYNGTPKAGGPGAGPGPGGASAVQTQSDEFQAAWYFRNSVLGFAAGVRRYFIDLLGQDNTTIGGASVFNEKREARPFLRTLQLVGDRLDGFTDVEKVAEGQYKFVTPDGIAYALWDGELPDGASDGIAYDMYGDKTTSATFSEESPILVVVE